MGVGVAEGRYAREVFDDALALAAHQWFVNPEDVRISMDVNDRLAERERFFFQRGDE